eukprot:CAMPEP_0204196988 /NCGR_PEP_ID=MMETSP0361-20130328/64235_1 /ASSEMBLY_ACC=CAM_ASM_000343 /TAXON_ID=268821 /ORGANISM="Scrippsiella Hangoei, Strain SHTV-5" /LENGTH=118 /DNA_ID=CAMNT_0051158835 /DNA_START=37 /DNA_END=390 /DNA_ORIENTATION=+
MVKKFALFACCSYGLELGFLDRTACPRLSGLDVFWFEFRQAHSQPRTPPSLSDKVPVIIAYCDKLNVAGTDPVDVNVVKNRVVAHLRGLGFGVHEETSASVSSTSLGYDIDGHRGIIS